MLLLTLEGTKIYVFYNGLDLEFSFKFSENA
jgi:hypothetical protein